jgi:hypothetical protein
MPPGPATTQGIRATGYSPAADAEPSDTVIDLDRLWHDYQRSRVWMSARDRKRATYVARTEHPTGVAVMRF